MFIVLTYDVNIASQDGARRLRKVARLCESYGIRVQNSVFELLVDNAQLTIIKASLNRIIDTENDSIRLYQLSKNWESKVEVIGKEARVKQGDTLIL